MPERVDPSIFAAAGLAVLALLALSLRLRGRGALVRRLSAVSSRLDEPTASVHGGGGVESALSRVERAAERALLRNDGTAGERSRLLGVLEELAEGVVVADERGKVVLSNRAAEAWGADRQGEAITAKAVADLLDSAVAGTGTEQELRLFGPPRRVLWVRAVPLDDGSKPIGGAVFVRDVSEARRVENVRRDFVTNVSHELKTPIGAVGLLAETMADERDPEVMRRLAERVVKESERLARIVEDLLDLSLLEAQEAPQRDPVPVSLLMADALDRMAAGAEAAGIPIEVAEPPSGLEISCDRRQVTSALFNLLDNAVKYSEVGGKVELSADLELSANQEVVSAVLAVRDHGMGIPSAERERIFERFYRVDRARARATGGTGLGLAIVRHVAQAHGGDVSVISEEGRGSTFYLRFPIAHDPNPGRR